MKRRPSKPPKFTFPRRPGDRRRELLAFIERMRPWFLLAALLAAYALSQPSLVPPRGLLVAERQVVDSHFTRCHDRRSAACVVDGDTIRIDGADVRLVGFNTPEYSDAKCAREKVLAEQATVAVHKLLNDGPVALLRDRRDSVDRYGRALRTAMLVYEGGSEKPLADEMIALGLAEPYWGGSRRDWC